MKRGILVFGLCFSVTASAEPLSYEQAVSAVLSQNPTLVRSELDVDRAEASLMAAWGGFDPNFSASGSWRKSTQKGFFQGFPYASNSSSWSAAAGLTGFAPSGTSYSLTTGLDRNYSRYVTDFGVGENESIQDAYTSDVAVSVSQQLLRGFRLSDNLRYVRTAERTRDATTLLAEQQRQSIIYEAAAAYWAWAYATKAAEIAKDAEATAVEAERVGALRRKAGDLAPLELTRLEAAVVTAKTSRVEAERSAASSERALLLLMGEDSGTSHEPSSNLHDIAPMDVDTAIFVERALRSNPEVAIARQQFDSAKLDATYARHDVLPSLTANASAGIGAQDETAGQAIAGLTSDSAFPFVSLGGELSVPIGNRAARGQRDAAEASVHAAESRVQEAERTVRSQVADAVDALRAAWQRVELADSNLRLADQTVTAEEAIAKAGDSVLKDVLEARTGLAQARAEAERARADYRLAEVALLRLEGGLGTP